ncbi:hypothetical protein IAQ61_009357 [Plenodomus lingam]|uniref:Similar to ATP-dependent Zn protease n=1 Tax=Leptosphaeria maculans (strain JN3 / isolate v23.1.3 / race Av1-4-5-6-7-8) TaxID=985895 RepID=E4ZTW3_LEPMJ|nr:similar to ATP-dependent Zn protease [Plenodomus lingam JN3]KAH9863082.1 hypothetical protein IAQ61_009357 [Plenodomus lingam]CBX94673.1 similar to ATP-dependent Zn protease [Plenodomus lingam JN3]
MAPPHPTGDTDAHVDMASLAYFDHSTAKRINTDAVLVEALRTQYPHLDLVVAPQAGLNLLAYAAAGHAKAIPLDDTVKDHVYGPGLSWRIYTPPPRRLDTRPGSMVEKLLFGKFMYKWKDQEAILYVANGRDGGAYYPSLTNHYLLTNATHKVDELIKEATTWGMELHNEVWVFDSGMWQKSAELYDSVQKSDWSQVILDEDMKKALISDVETFFDSQQTYADLKVPWKRGIIYYGPPGNGKTISIKAMMHSLYQRGQGSDARTPVPTLYVRSLASFGGPEYAISQIFAKARQEAPCYLVFEDLDSIVHDDVRSYFLNEVDGLRANDGILMVGSTNHLDRLDPGIAKRPSRFDRKYYFPNPDLAQRVQYAHFWQTKLQSNKDLVFPDALCDAIAQITHDFSFAYMQEAFVAALLAIAARGGKSASQAALEAKRWAGPCDPMTHINDDEPLLGRGHGHGYPPNGQADLEKLELWIEIQKQVKILREEMDEKVDRVASVDSRSSLLQYRDELDAVLHGRRQGPLGLEKLLAKMQF